MNDNKNNDMNNSKDIKSKSSKIGNAQKSLLMIIVLGIIIVAIIMIFKFSGNLFEEEKPTVEFKNSEANFMEDYTYRFTGESKHFIFETGQVLYDGSQRFLFINNVKLKKKVSGDDYSFAFNVYFNDKIVFGNDQGVGNTNKDELGKIRIGILGSNEKDHEKGPYEPFIVTTAKNFKESIKIEGVYCKGNKCERENFKLFFTEKAKKKK